MSKYKNAVLAIDISSETKALIDQAKELTQTLGCKLHVVHICAAVPMGYGEYMPMFAEQILEAAQEQMDKVAKESDIARECIYIEQGDAAEMILGLVKQVEASLILIGHHSHSTVERLFVGSVANKVLNHAACDVLTLHVE